MYRASVEYRNRRKALLGFAAIALIPLAGCAPTTQSVSTTTELSSTEGSKLDPLRIVPEEDRLEFTLLNPGETVSIEVSDLEVDFDCVDRSIWSADTDSASIRIGLITSGCATLLPGTGTAEEQAAQAEVRAELSPSTTATPAVQSPPESDEGEPETDDFFSTLLMWGNVIVQFLRTSWQWIVGIAVAIFLGAVFQQWYRSKHVRVILAGAPSAGKTDFWTALRKDSEPNSGGKPTVGSRTEPLVPLEMGRSTLYPHAMDTAGSQPELVLDAVRQPWAIRRWKQKIVLVVVISPSPDDGSSSRKPYDDAFIQQQIGYLSLPCAIVRTKNALKRPNAVVLFVSKFDLLSTNPPSDTASEQTGRELRSRFDQHRKLLEGACTQSNVPFEFIVGSANRGWGIDKARKALWDSVRK